MNLKNSFILITLALLNTVTFAQQKDLKTSPITSKETQTIQQKKQENPLPDYKIISSNQNYIEIEFTPQYVSSSNGKYDFTGSLFNGNKFGQPDLRFKSFPVYFTSQNNNKVEIIDSKYELINGVDIQPIPTPKRYIKNDKEVISSDLIKDSKAYSQNKFLPLDSPAEIGGVGALRNRYLGNLNLYPLQYNPASKVLKKYTSIRVRITFGSSPVYLNKALSIEEKEFLRGVAVNYIEAENWSTVEFNNMKDNSAINSVFAAGDFFRIEIKENGMYKLDKSYLQGAGINVGAINPKTIKIYGNNGREVPYNNCDIYPEDPIENAIYVEGENDGVFNDNDYVAFYGKGSSDWLYDSTQNTFRHYLNPYTKSNYYWVTYGGANGLRMAAEISQNSPGAPVSPYFIDRAFEEPEVNNLGATGLLWVSQRIGLNDSYNFNRELKGYIEGTDVNLRLRLGNGSTILNTFIITDANSPSAIFPMIFSVYPIGGFGSFAKVNLDRIGNPGDGMGIFYPLSPGRNSISVKASLPSSAGNTSLGAGYYDYYEILYRRAYNTADGNYLRFNGPDTNVIVEYKPGGFNTPDVKVFDVTNFPAAKQIIPISYSGGEVRFQSESAVNVPKEFYVIGGTNYKTPASISGRMANQDIKGSLAAGADMVVFYPKEFSTAANRYKTYRENSGLNSLKVILIDIDQVYNEFSSGAVDPIAMRNFLKYAYNNWTIRPTYVMFFGDGTYDYKNIYNISTRNFLPPVELNSDQSDDIASYCSDDFACEVNECFSFPTPSKTDFASGRLCINTESEANTVIDKIIAYENPSNYGRWRDKIMYVADDGWTTENNQGQEGSLHTGQCEDLAENHTPRYFEKEKIYIVSYPAITTPQGRRKPEVNPAIINGWNEGRLVINYTGHGSTDLWAHEHIFERQISIPLLNNVNKYPFLTIASCDLARWDDPYAVSAGEQLVTEVNRGAIGVMAAVRPVYSSPNAEFNNLLWDNYAFKKDTFNLPIRIGKAMFNVKQIRFLENDLKFSLLCDPSVRIGIPQYFTKIDSINSTPGSELTEMKALQKIKISGSVLRPDSSFWADYNGNISLKVLDVDKPIHLEDFGFPFDFRLDGGIIFTGNTTVSNGKWQVEFIVPKDISYSTGFGKILAYFQNATSDGVGFSNNFTVNGIDSTAAQDSIGPKISVFFDSKNFRSGDLVNQNPKLIVDFYDDFGMNLTGTIGHKIEATLNNNQENKIDLTQFYNTTSGYQYGSVVYQFQGLQPGRNTISIKAYDTYNNYSIATADFMVQNSAELTLANVYNYPNPMMETTAFVFNHNFDRPLNANIKIYTVSGRLIKELNKSGITDKFVSIDWDGRDADGDALANGTYIYKLTIKSDDGTFTQSNINKLAKLK